MPMALGPFHPLLVLLTIFLAAFAVSTRGTADGKAPAPTLMPTPPPADSRFLQACCANTTNASVCYDSLLPSAASFHGNRVKVAGAAAVVAFARLRSFYNELRRLQPGGTGAGRVADMGLKSCAMFTFVPRDKEDNALASLRRLETAAGRRRGEQARLDLREALDVSEVESGITNCLDDFSTMGDAVLASPVVKKVLAWAANVRIYGYIAVDLVESIEL